MRQNPKVRLSFPTTVVADFVRRGHFPLSDVAVAPTQVADFLAAHEGQFAIGREPIEAYLARIQLTSTAAPVVAQIKRLQRVYQITPDDQSRFCRINSGPPDSSKLTSLFLS